MRQLFLEGRPLHIFPCRADKRPCTPHGHLDAASDAPSITKLWSRYPGPLTGVATGAVGGIAAIDVDERGEGWFHAHRDQLPATRTHKTPRGLWHLIYHHAIGLRCSNSKIAPGIDVKADGGYIIWWPASLGRVVCGGPVADFPVWLLSILGSQGDGCARLGPPLPLNPNREHPPPLETTRNLPRRVDRILKVVRPRIPAPATLDCFGPRVGSLRSLPKVD
jgi:hypothetical protein